MIEAVKAFWLDKTDHERSGITFAAILVVLALGYAYAWLPMTTQRERLLTSRLQLRAAARDVERDVYELERLKGAALPASTDLRAVLERTAAASGIKFGTIEIAHQSAGRVRIAIPAVRAPQWLDWTARMQAVPGLRIESVRMILHGDGDQAGVEAVLVQLGRPVP